MDKHIIYQAYQQMLLNNFKSGLIGQHLSEKDYAAFKEYPEILCTLLSSESNIYGHGKLLGDFFNIYPDMKTNIPFNEKILQVTVSNYDVQLIIRNCGEKILINNKKLFRKLCENKNTEDLFNGYQTPIKSIKTSQEMHDVVCDLENYNYRWFNLPITDNIEKVKTIISKDLESYNFLPMELKINTEVISAVLTSKNLTSGLMDKLYQMMPPEIQECPNVVNRLCDFGLEPPLKFLMDEKIYEKLVNQKFNIYNNTKTRRNNISSLTLLTEINIQTLNNPKNLLTFFAKLNDISETLLAGKDTYSEFYKTIKESVKNNSLLKYLINKNKDMKDNHWTILAPKEFAHSARSGSWFFKNNIPLMYADIKLLTLKEDISKEMDKEINSKKIEAKRNKI